MRKRKQALSIARSPPREYASALVENFDNSAHQQPSQDHRVVARDQRLLIRRYGRRYRIGSCLYVHRIGWRATDLMVGSLARDLTRRYVAGGMQRPGAYGVPGLG